MEIDYVKSGAIIFGCVVVILNFMFFVFWIWTGQLHGAGPYARPVDTYDAISLQITILGVAITAVAIGLAIAAVFGYQGLRDHMLMRVDEQINLRFQNQLSKGTGPGLSPKGPEPPTDGGIQQVMEG